MSRKIQPSNYLLLLTIILVGVFSIIDLSPQLKDPHEFVTITDTTTIVIPVTDEEKLKQDSLDREDFCEKLKLSNPGKGFYAGFGGYTLINDPDSCHLKDPTSSYTDKHFLVLMGYHLKPSSWFYIRKGKYYLKSIVWEKNESGVANGHYIHTEIPVRYVASETSNTGKGLVLLPVTEKKFKTIKAIADIIIIVLSAGVIILLFMVLRIFYRCARKKMFIKRNVRDLYIIGWSLVAAAIIPNIMAIIFSLIFAAQISAEFYLPLQETLLQNRGLLIPGLVVLFIASVFKRGYMVQSDINLFT